MGGNAVTVVQFAASLLIARLLTPNEMGVYSVAAAFVAIAGMVRDFGVSPYLIRADQVDRDLARTGLGLLMLLAVVLSLITALSADTLAGFYRDPRIADILNLLAFNFLLTPFGAITVAIARRNMRFKALAYISITGAIASAGVSVILAYRGYGPISLAWGGLAGTVATVLSTVFIRPFSGILIPTLKGAGKIAKFGIAATGGHLVAHANSQSSDLILGRMLSLELVGLFNRAKTLTETVHTVLQSSAGPVFLPWLSKIRREGEDHQESYAKIVEYTTGITWPFLAILAVYAHETLLLLYGDQWARSAPLVPYLCVSAAILSAYSVCSPLYLSVGKPKLDVSVQSFVLVIRIGMLMIAAPYGLETVAFAWLTTTVVEGLVQQIILIRILRITIKTTAQAVTRSALVAATGLVVASSLNGLIGGQIHYAVELFMVGAVSAVSALLVGLLVRHPIAMLGWGYLQKMRGADTVQ